MWNLVDERRSVRSDGGVSRASRTRCDHTRVKAGPEAAVSATGARARGHVDDVSRFGCDPHLPVVFGGESESPAARSIETVPTLFGEHGFSFFRTRHPATADGLLGFVLDRSGQAQPIAARSNPPSFAFKAALLRICPARIEVGGRLIRQVVQSAAACIDDVDVGLAVRGHAECQPITGRRPVRTGDSLLILDHRPPVAGIGVHDPQSCSCGSTGGTRRTRSGCLSETMPGRRRTRRRR